MRSRLALVLVVMSSCAWTPRQRDAFFRDLGKVLVVTTEVGKATAVATAKKVICSRIETRREIPGVGYFEVPRGACRHSQAPNGNLVFTFAGSGHFVKYGGLASGDFEQEVLVEYQVRLAGGYVYVLPDRVEVYRPRVFNLSLFAGLGELMGLVSDKVRAVIDDNMNKPRTIILSLQGRLCVVEGWIPPRAIPSRCNGQNADDSFVPAGGSYAAQDRAPEGWSNEGLNVTEALTPSPLPQDDSVAVSDAAPTPEPDRPAMEPVPPPAPPASESVDTSQPSEPSASPAPLVEASPESLPPPPVVEVATATRRRGPLVRAAQAEPPPPETPLVEAMVERPPPGPAPTRSLNWARVEDGAMGEFVRRNGSALAEKIQQLAHPAGKRPGLLAFEVRAEAGLTSVELEVVWSGRVAGSTYRTTVIWEFSKQEHIRLVVASDTSGAPVSAEAVGQLDEYFRSSVFLELGRSLSSIER